MSLFNKDKSKKKEEDSKVPSPWGQSTEKWWAGMREMFKKDTGKEESDPEFNVQNIYGHWLKSFK